MDNKDKFFEIILRYRVGLQKKIKEREVEMQSDNNDHYILYNVLGFTNEAGYRIDYQQNVGRYLYKYAGSLMEELATECFKIAYFFPILLIRVRR